MTDALGVRQFIVEFLRKEIVGPSPGFPAVQLNGEEILRAQDPPRRRYGAGVLFPMRSQVPRQDQTGTDEPASSEAASPEEDPSSQGSKVVESDSEPTRDEGSSDTDRDVTLANEFLPSALGLSALVDVPQVLRVNVEAAVYRHAPLHEHGRAGGEEQDAGPKWWWRMPVNRQVELGVGELVAPTTVVLEKPVLSEDGRSVLSLHVVSRPYDAGDATGRARLITFTLINRHQSESKTPDNSDCFFQCGFSVTEADQGACFLSYPEPPHLRTDPEELSLQLLHLHRRTFAVGHGCAADWEALEYERAISVRTEVMPTYEVKPVLPREIAELDLQMMKLAGERPNVTTELCSRLCDEYEKWIITKEQEISLGRTIPSELVQTALRHMENCRECLRRMRDGVRLLDDDPVIALAFRMMNQAMLMQQIHYGISAQSRRAWHFEAGDLRLEEPFHRPSYDDPERTWRPFQLAFILMNLKSVSKRNCSERKIVDVIWFPTGGGKTEAYLGLAGFSMLLRRLRDPGNGGTCSIMRYTLRLLTTQQFQRAASLICACEIIRRDHVEALGKERFTLGLWVGGEVTPNTERDAVHALRELHSRQGVNKFIVLSCPWCGAGMGPFQAGRTTRCKGYRKLAHPNRVRHVCEDPDCDFSKEDGLPLAVIDEQIYESPPTLIIGTVDKFAMLAFRPDARRMFGIDTPYRPPELIIQDELHLISGPLGSMVGHYEVAVEALCTEEVAGTPVAPKIIGSTATISRAESQVNGLYGRQTFLFPPQALRAGDSFFAEEREQEPGRLYVGVFATALPSHVTAQVRTMAALLQAPKLVEDTDEETIDPYWTMMGYFNSLRELGHAATLVRADIREFLNAMWDRLGLRVESVRAARADRRRFLKPSVELTSRVQSNEIPEILQRLFANYDGRKASDVVDVCFATNMIQVGLDVPRLSLMTIVGQPKTSSEYIQASSRVGREVRKPGIVVLNYNVSKPRDRSHYEHFRSYHQGIYRHVEPTSVTAFSQPVRERALHALVVILCRFWGDEEIRERPAPPPKAELVQRVKDAIRERVLAVDPQEWSGTEGLIDQFIRRWATTQPFRYGDFGPPEEDPPLMYPAGGQMHPQWQNWPFATPSSMRNVDAECSARQLLGGYGEHGSA